VYKEGTIVLRGVWLYARSVETEVVIQKMPVIYGVNDDELPPELSDDQYIENYYIWYGTPGKRGEFRTGGGCELTLEEAKRNVEIAVGQPVRWKEVTNPQEMIT
jgi:hypothetical protein